MKCVKCGSENVIIESKKAKNSIMIGCVLTLGGIGLMIFGIIGIVIGVVLGFIIGVIVKSLAKEVYESWGVCQDCGKTWNITAEESNKRISEKRKKK